MKKYHKIQTIFKRDMENKGKIILGEYACPEFGLLKDIEWVFTEKIDGTNIRVSWDGENVKFGGRTDNAQIPTILIERLQQLFPKELLMEKLSNPLCLYGEGFGAKIQKGGGNYNPDGVDFILFDVQVDDWWLKRDIVESIALSLAIKTVPVVGQGTLSDAVDLVRNDFKSQWGDFSAEGFVIKPAIDLFNRKGERIITKIKHKDFK